MNILKLSWKNIIFRPLSSGLSILLMAAGITIILLTLLTTSQLDDKFKKNIKDIDFVVGAKGGSLQILLCNVFQVEKPVGNIKWAYLNSIKNYPLVDVAIPISMGDNYHGHRIVGTDTAYISLFNGTLAEGAYFKDPLEVVVGSSVANKFNLNIGSDFVGGHGLGESVHYHSDMVYKVVGILNQNGTVLDNLVLCSLESYWLVHAGENHGGAENLEVKTVDDTTAEKIQTIEEFKKQDSLDNLSDSVITYVEEPKQIKKQNYDSLLKSLNPLEKEITGILIKVKGSGKSKAKAKVSVPAFINKYDDMMSIDVAIEMQKLSDLMMPAAGVIEWLVYIIMFIAAISLFVAMFNSLKDRNYEIAIMRVLGSSSLKVFASIVLEGIYLSLLGFLAGWLIAHTAMYFFADMLSAEYNYDFSGWILLKEELYLLLGALTIGIISALYPAYKAYNTDISETLSN